MSTSCLNFGVVKVPSLSYLVVNYGVKIVLVFLQKIIKLCLVNTNPHSVYLPYIRIFHQCNVLKRSDVTHMTILKLKYCSF